MLIPFFVLIDADALINNIPSEEIIAKMFVAHAPTIEPAEEFEWCTDCKEYDQEKHCCHRWSKQIRKTVAELEEYYKPKRGEWIRTERMGTFKLYDCSVCGIHIEAPWNFCPNCGADMRKGADDE